MMYLLEKSEIGINLHRVYFLQILSPHQALYYYIHMALNGHKSGISKFMKNEPVYLNFVPSKSCTNICVHSLQVYSSICFTVHCYQQIYRCQK